MKYLKLPFKKALTPAPKNSLGENLLKEKGVSHIQAFKAVRISSSIYSYK
jgi:hypothetical protein